jgi:hypothetical protein
MVLMKMKLATEGSSHPLIGPEPVLLISAKVARGVIRDWTRRKHKNRQSTRGQKHIIGSLKKNPSAKKTAEQKTDNNNDRGC